MRWQKYFIQENDMNKKKFAIDAVADDDSAAEIAQDTNGELYDLLRPLEGIANCAY